LNNRKPEREKKIATAISPNPEMNNVIARIRGSDVTPDRKNTDE
jgi:hypothetical protein